MVFDSQIDFLVVFIVCGLFNESFKSRIRLGFFFCNFSTGNPYLADKYVVFIIRWKYGIS